jgi:hypothetical protein
VGHGIDALFKFTATWDLLGQTCQNVWFFRAREDDHSDTLDEDVNFMLNDTYPWLLEPMLHCMSQDVTLIQTDAVCVSPLSGPSALKIFSGIGGLIADNSLPSYVASLISAHTGYSGRRTHGRTYLCGVPKSHQDGNNLTALGLTALANAAHSWVSRYGRDGTSTRWYGVVFSKANGVTRDPGPPPALHYLPLAGIPWRYVDAREKLFTQRHRLAGRGI